MYILCQHIIGSKFINRLSSIVKANHDIDFESDICDDIITKRQFVFVFPFCLLGGWFACYVWHVCVCVRITGSTGKISFEDFQQLMKAKMAEKDSNEEILKAFRLFDDDETGKISFKNLKRVAKELGENLNDEELQEMLEEADLDGDGEVNEEEFLRVMKKTSLY